MSAQTFHVNRTSEKSRWRLFVLILAAFLVDVTNALRLVLSLWSGWSRGLREHARSQDTFKIASKTYPQELHIAFYQARSEETICVKRFFTAQCRLAVAQEAWKIAKDRLKKCMARRARIQSLRQRRENERTAKIIKMQRHRKNSPLTKHPFLTLAKSRHRNRSLFPF